MLRVARWSWLLAGLAVGCAGGAKPDNTTTFGPAPASGTSQGGSDSEEPDEDEGTTVLPTEEGTDEGFFTTTGVGGDTTGLEDEGTTTDEPPGGSSDSGPMGNCADPGTCPTATLMGAVSGDMGSSPIQASGQQPDWLTFQVTEDDDAIEGAGMSFTVTLTSPAGADFDLYVYRGVEGGGTGCGGFLQMSTNGGGIDEVSMSWGEGFVANGVDDSVWVAVEVVAENDMCAPPQEWNLLVEGNT